jgi:hypothetical protein
MPERLPIEIRSEEVQEIISHVPNSLVRWGLTVIFLVMVALLSVTWFIQYPDLLAAKVTITTKIQDGFDTVCPTGNVFPDTG